MNHYHRGCVANCKALTLTNYFNCPEKVCPARVAATRYMWGRACTHKQAYTCVRVIALGLLLKPKSPLPKSPCPGLTELQSRK